MTESPDDIRARKRFMAINAVRLGGVAMVLIGLLMIEGVIEAPDIAAYVMIVLGVVEVFLIPQMLARAWRTPKP